MHGARLRQCQARLETKLLGCLVDSREDFDIAALAGNDSCFFTSPAEVGCFRLRPINISELG
jgi:hypothetical protein